MEFCVFITLSHGEVTSGSDYFLRCSINPFATWLYKWLCVNEVVQTSIWYRYGTQQNLGELLLLWLRLLILVGVYTIFHFSVFHDINIFSNEYNVKFYHAFRYILLVLKLGNQTKSGWFIQFFVHTVYILGSISFYNVYQIVSSQ